LAKNEGIFQDMDLTINKHVAAFGLFQLVYSALDERITGAVLKFSSAGAVDVGISKWVQDFRLRRKCVGKPGPLTETEVRQMKFSEKVRFLKHAIKPLKTGRRPDPLSQDLQAMEEAFKSIGEVSKWRNDRAHARVIFGAELTLVNDEGKPLPITYTDSVKHIGKAQDAILRLEANTRDLTNAIRTRARIRRVLAETE
jgi:hypothetical protein